MGAGSKHPSEQTLMEYDEQNWRRSFMAFA